MTVTLHTFDTIAPDDHNGPGILVEDDRPPIFVWSLHGAGANLYVRKGTTPQDLTPGSFAATELVAFGDQTSYAQIFRIGTDDLIVFARYRSGANYRWGFVLSDDYGDSWGPMQPLFFAPTTGHFYSDPVQVGNVIRFGLFLFAVGDLYYLELDTTTGQITRSDGTPLANLDGTSLPYTLTTDDRVYDTVTGGARLLEVSAATDPEIVLVSWTTTSDAVYRYLKRSAGVWAAPKTIIAAGQGLGVQTDRYYGGAAFPNPGTGGTLYTARENAGSWYIDRHETADAGDSWTKTELRSSGHPLVRPICPVGRITGPPLYYHRVTRYGAYDDWDASLHAVAA